MPTNATNSSSGCFVFPDITLCVLLRVSVSCHIVQRLALPPRSPYSRVRCVTLTSSEYSFRSKARPAARDSVNKHRVLGDKTRSRGTPLPVTIVRQPAANFIRNHFHIPRHLPLRCFHKSEPRRLTLASLL